MKVLAVLSVLCLAIAVNAGYVTEKQYQNEFSRFVKIFGKKYVTDDFFNRYETFKANLDLIERHNSQPGVTSTMGINKFSDLSSEEFASRMNGLTVPKKTGKVLPIRSTKGAPVSLDWREKGAVTSVKDQGQCGSWYV